jgi:dynein heavy chain
MGMFQTCLSLLSAMVSENMQVSGELHIERIYLFCLMWSYGSFLNDKDRKAFNELLKTLSTA